MFSMLVGSRNQVCFVGAFTPLHPWVRPGDLKLCIFSRKWG